MKLQVVTVTESSQLRSTTFSQVEDPGLSFEAEAEGKSLLEMSAKSLEAPIFVRFGPAEYLLEIELSALRQFLDETEAKVRESHSRPVWTPSE